MNQTKATLVEHVANTTGFTKKDVEEVIEHAVEFIKAMPVGGKLELRQFGTFVRKAVDARKRRNPRTGEFVQAPAHTTLRFKASKMLRK